MAGRLLLTGPARPDASRPGRPEAPPDPGGEVRLADRSAGEASIVSTHSASPAASAAPLSSRNVSTETNAVRLLPSTKGWFLASP